MITTKSSNQSREKLKFLSAMLLLCLSFLGEMEAIFSHCRICAKTSISSHCRAGDKRSIRDTNFQGPQIQRFFRVQFPICHRNFMKIFN